MSRTVRTGIIISATLALLPSCKREFNQSAEVMHTGELPLRSEGPFRFDVLTPTGEKLFQEALDWIVEQPTHRAQPANCAYNVSDVYRNAGFGNVYASPLVIEMVDKVAAKQGSKVVRMGTKSKASVIEKLNSNFGGKIPAGALVAGCLNTDCSGASGDGHIAMLGDIDADGYTLLYHNNWYRPKAPDYQRRPYMISKAHFDSGCPRQWMPTPWAKFVRDASGKITDMIPAYPSMHGIDDLDFFTYFGFVAVIPDLWREVQAGQVKTSIAASCKVNGSDGMMNVRKGPSGGHEKVIESGLPNGTLVKAVAKEGSWFKVEFTYQGQSYRDAFISQSGLQCSRMVGAGEATAKENGDLRGAHLRRGPKQLSELGATGVCKVSTGTKVGFVSSTRMNESWTKIVVQDPIPECSSFTGELYIFNQHFTVQTP